MRLPTTPVIPGFHPDPSVCAVGGEFFLVNSSFEYAPAVPVFRSSDLRSWTQIGHVLERAEQFTPSSTRPSGGVYAPTLRHHDGRFWMITTNVDDGPGQLLVSATDPGGPWSDPIRVPGAVGIDPDLAWDEDGTAWITWSGELPPGAQGILQARLDLRSGELGSRPEVLWRGTGGQFPEGPHLYHVHGFWYLLIAEGGTERGHAVTVARSTSISGPYEPAASSPLLTARSTASPTQSTGHGDLVQRSDGSWAMVFLGTRPRGSTPAWHVLGRETFAVEVAWEDGWPVIGAPVEPRRPSTSVEELPASAIPLTWVSPDAFPSDVLSRKREAWTLRPRGGTTFVGRRQEHFFTRTSARLHPRSGTAALEIRIDPSHRVLIETDGARAQAVAVIDDQWFSLGSSVAVSDVVVEIRTEPARGRAGTPRNGPDQIVLGIRTGSTFTSLGQLDGRYLSTEVAGGFTGRMIGISAAAETSVASFRYEGTDDATARA